MKCFVGIIVSSGEVRRPAVGARIPQLAVVANRPLIDHALDTLGDAGVRRAYIVAPNDQFAELDTAVRRRTGAVPKIELLGIGGPVDTARALATVAPRIDDSPVIVHSGDLLLRTGLREAARSFVQRHVPAMLVAASSGTAVTALETKRMLRLCDGAAPGDVPTSVQLLGPDAVAALVDGGSNTPSGFEVALAGIAQSGRSIAIDHIAQWWRYDGTMDNLLEGNRLALDEMTAMSDPVVGPDVRVQGKVSIDPTASVEASTIRGPAIIGAGARIREAYVGPYTCIGEHVVVEGAEIEHSIVLEGAEITYVGRRIEASIVGANATVRRDFSLPQAHRLKLGDDAEICLAQ